MNDPLRRPRRPDRQVIPPLYAHHGPGIIRPCGLPPVMQTTLVATDIMGYARRYHGASALLYAWQAMYELVIAAFNITALPWWGCYREDRGDGTLIVAPPGISPGQILDPLIHHLNALLRSHARRAGQGMQLDLRMAIHYGYVYYDAHGVTGYALTHLYRLLEAPRSRRPSPQLEPTSAPSSPTSSIPRHSNTTF